MSDSNNNTKDYNLSPFRRNRYFYGKLMTVKDFDTEQNYVNEKRHLLNRLVNGAGVICGLGLDDVEVSAPEESGGNVKIQFKTGGVAIDCWGREIVVPVPGEKREIFVKEGSTESNLTTSLVGAARYYLYLEYDPRIGEMVSSALENSSCEENRIIEDFKVIASKDGPGTLDTQTIVCPDFTSETPGYDAKQEVKDWLKDRTSGLCTVPDEGRVFFLALNQGSSPVSINVDETNKYLSFVTNNRAFSELLACHLSDFGNPHKTLVGLDVEEKEGVVKVDHYHGYITIEKSDDSETSNAITLDAEPGNHKILIGETHSSKRDNPHDVKMSQLEDFNADNHKISNLETPTDNKHAANKEYVDDKDTELRDYVDVREIAIKDYSDDKDSELRTHVDTKDTELRDYVNTREIAIRDYSDTKDTELRDYVDTREIAIKDYSDTKDSELRTHVDTKDTELRDYVDTREIAIRDYSDTKDSELRTHVDTEDTELRDYVDTREIAIRDYSDTKDSELRTHVDTKDTELRDYVDAKTTAVQEGALSTSGGFVTGPIHIKTEEWSALTGNATTTYGVMGRLTQDLDTGSSYRTAGVVGVSEIEGKHGVYAKAPEGTHALYVQGSARFTGAKTGYVVDVFKNAGGKTLKTGDVVKLKGTPVNRFFGDNDKIPVAEVTMADKENDNCTIGIVDRKAIPEEIKKGKKSKAEDPSVIKDGEELYVVTLGTYFRCKVDAANAPIKVGDLLTSSKNPGFARKAADPKIGSIIGKALEPLGKGTGYIAVFVNIQ